MHGRSRFRTRARGSGAALSPFLFQASTYGATDAWDFVNDQYIRGGLLSDGGISITRASVGTAETADGRIVTFGSGQLRRTDKGILVEGARTNLFLNSLVGETQTITVTAVAHTLSFYGTGTITLSGTSTAGPLIGTGAGQRVTLTFTPTAGNLTLTVSGTVEYVQLEVSAGATSWIPTEGTSVQRATDDIEVPYATIPNVSPITFFAEYDASVFTSDALVGPRIFNWASSATANVLRRTSATEVSARFASSGTAAIQSGLPTTIQKVAVAYVFGQATKLSANGLAVVTGTDAGIAIPASNLQIGNIYALTGSLNTYLRRFALIPRTLSDAELQEIST